MKFNVSEFFVVLIYETQVKRNILVLLRQIKCLKTHLSVSIGMSVQGLTVDSGVKRRIWSNYLSSHSLPCFCLRNELASRKQVFQERRNCISEFNLECKMLAVSLHITKVSQTGILNNHLKLDLKHF